VITAKNKEVYVTQLKISHQHFERQAEENNEEDRTAGLRAENRNRSRVNLEESIKSLNTYILMISTWALLSSLH
jgi:hypothetical protein